jgi:hypothetical protein
MRHEYVVEEMRRGQWVPVARFDGQKAAEHCAARLRAIYKGGRFYRVAESRAAVRSEAS